MHFIYEYQTKHTNIPKKNIIIRAVKIKYVSLPSETPLHLRVGVFSHLLCPSDGTTVSAAASSSLRFLMMQSGQNGSSAAIDYLHC